MSLLSGFKNPWESGGALDSGVLKGNALEGNILQHNTLSAVVQESFFLEPHESMPTKDLNKLKRSFLVYTHNATTNEFSKGWVKSEHRVSKRKFKQILTDAHKIHAKQKIYLYFKEVKTLNEVRDLKLNEHQLFIAVSDSELPPGLTSWLKHDTSSGVIELVDEMQFQDELAVPTPTTFASYRWAYENHKNSTYATGYLVAHEILHQILEKARIAIKGRRSHSISHNNGEPNLNKDGLQVTIPPHSSDIIQDAEKILPNQIKIINEYIQLRWEKHIQLWKKNLK